MEMKTIPLSEYNKLLMKVERLKQLEKLDFELVRKFTNSLEDVKEGRIRRVA